MTAGAPAVPLSGVAGTSHVTKRRLPVLPVASMLQAQQTLTAVERFATKHEEGSVPLQAKYYRDLIPLDRPRPGEQYAFQVDLDACTGCKACVSACHSLNGLDESEVWRTVGLLQGGTSAAPAMQTVTTACHHCVDPACMIGCPTKAYEKDPITGIVKHLDDQCFGCEYCTLMCPYDAPKYNKAKGIVRKCDMCSERLEHGEAPACVQACPNQAISIQVVDKAAVVQVSDAQSFLPGAPAPEHTLPTTVYKTSKALPSNMLPADFYRTSPEHSHPPLVVMLTLTQLSVGAFITEFSVERLTGMPAGNSVVQTVFATMLAIVALAASVLHLGRPHLAWRAFLGFRRSWLSREAVAFAVFALLAASYGVSAAAPLLPVLGDKNAIAAAAPVLQDAAVLAGLLGVFCSVMVYVATRRKQWSGTQTGVKFFGSTLLLGAAMFLAVTACISRRTEPLDHISRSLFFLVVAVTAIKVGLDASVLFHFRDPRQSTWKRMALVMLGDLRTATNLRFGFALTGGILIPFLVWMGGFVGRMMAPATAVMLVFIVVGELAERYLFFRAAPASRMPGGI
jgi:Fe-S-cluster-containing dehydrogenase component/DMSO reductase anchor subunit